MSSTQTNHPSVSFIVPYYNIETRLLTRCIDSIIALGDHIDWELIIIDDGTPHSPAQELVGTYNDKRIKYTIIEHAGLGGARNTGLDIASKEYIQMVDSDDYLFAPAQHAILNILQERKPDALIFDYKKVHLTTIEPHDDRPAGRILHDGEATHYMLTHDMPPSACRYIIKRTTIGPLRFTPHIFHEDEEFSALLTLQINHIIVTTHCPYAYYQRPESITNTQNSEVIKQRFADLRGIASRLQAVERQMKADDNRRPVLQRKIHILALCIIVNLIRTAPDTAFIGSQLAHLKASALYPLPSAPHGMRYKAIRLLTITPLLVKISGRMFRAFTNR